MYEIVPATTETALERLSQCIEARLHRTWVDEVDNCCNYCGNPETPANTVERISAWQLLGTTRMDIHPQIVTRINGYVVSTVHHTYCQETMVFTEHGWDTGRDMMERWVGFHNGTIEGMQANHAEGVAWATDPVIEPTVCIGAFEIGE